jgi:hypothetical protein
MRLRGFCLALLLLAALAPPAFAQSAPDPTAYALPASVFPPGSQVLASRVADNFDVALRHDQEGPQPTAGRVTGYYMLAQSMADSGSVRLATSYLVSIFDTSGHAASAFDQQNDYWHGLNPSSVHAQPAPALGDPGRARWYTQTDGNGDAHSELFFQRGTVLVELNLYSFQSVPTDADTASFLEMGGALDGAAQHPVSATLTPTATSTLTPTLEPTATPKKPRPTATTNAVSPQPETKPCKKGFKRVHGKCRRKKA